MESVKSYLRVPGLRLPSLASLRDGSFLTKALEKVDREAKKEQSFLKDFESQLVRVQEAAVWSSPLVSCVWVVVTQALLYTLSQYSLLTTLSCSLLTLYLYTTWVYTVWPAIRVPPGPGAEQDAAWTPLHPDVMSAPELETALASLRTRVAERVSSVLQTRRDQPGKFCTAATLVFSITAWLGTRLSLPLLLHSSLLVVLVLPAVLVRVARSPALAPWIAAVQEAVSGDPATYLDQFVPDSVDKEAEVALTTATTWSQDTSRDREAEYSLTETVTIPSHEEVDNDSLNNLLEFESGLQPVAALPPAEIGLGSYSDTESEDDSAVAGVRAGGGALLRGDGNSGEESDEDSLELGLDPGHLEPAPSSARVSAVSSLVTSNLSSLLGSVISNTSASASSRRRASDIDDFEFISQDELDEESI